MSAYKICTCLDGPLTSVRCSACSKWIHTTAADDHKFCWHCGEKFGPEPQQEPTPGEWYYIYPKACIYAGQSDGTEMCVADVAGSLKYSKANGYLMAASKKLLAALNGLLEHVGDDPCVAKSVLQQAREAIADTKPK